MSNNATSCESCCESLDKCDCGDTEVTNDNGVNCPYCGEFYEPDESYWYSESDQTEKCSCGKEFTWIGEQQGFTWTSRRID